MAGGRSGDTGRPETAVAPSDGQALLRQAVAALERHYTVAAEVTQKALLMGHEVIGSGTYCEQRSNQGLRFRLELTAQTSDDALASGLVQVCDGQYLWNYRKLRGNESLSRVDLAVVQRRLTESGSGQLAQILDGWPGLAGLPKLLRSFDRSFQFDSPEGVQLQAEFPAWKLEGRWRPEMLARVVPQHKDRIEQGRGVAREDLPEQLPNSVVLFLGKDDLFPYSIIFYRLDGNTTTVKASPNAPAAIVQVNLTKVRFNQPIAAGQFVYNPRLKYADETEAMLDRLGLE
ncbi:MAG: hypothetical protein ACYC6Y_22610 [Thermoguttaceae bacterium]